MAIDDEERTMPETPVSLFKQARDELQKAMALLNQAIQLIEPLQHKVTELETEVLAMKRRESRLEWRITELERRARPTDPAPPPGLPPMGGE